jgi:hypothetical protein
MNPDREPRIFSWRPATLTERRKSRRGRMRAQGRTPSRTAQESTANVITPFQALLPG